MKYRGLVHAGCFVLGLAICHICYGASILDSRHNLSVSGPGQIRASSESEVCIFCHTPHNSRQDIPFLWNRSDSTVSYIPYTSSTMYATVGQPTGASKLCLSCHDGTVAMGAVLSRAKEIDFLGGIRFMPADMPSHIGTDLSDDHPISFRYEQSISKGNTELAPPEALGNDLRLDADGQLQCTSCHDPHDDSLGDFLVVSNQFSLLCRRCHQKRGWENSSHEVSVSSWNGQGNDPWPTTDYNTVAENGCENCHQPHSAGNHKRILRHLYEEDTCLVCHNGNVASSDIETDLTKPYLHPVQDYQGIHDAAEGSSTGSMATHVECEDCHNPHMVTAATASAPAVSGANTGVRGVDISGLQLDESSNLYEICFLCHADTSVVEVPAIQRQIDQLNTRLEFSPGNPSYHPVAAASVSDNVTSLLDPYSHGSIIYCSDCHGSDDADGPKGVHGSYNRFLLVEPYTTTDMTVESPTAYALCYRCHDRGIILSGKSGFPLHRKHVEDARSPCAVCHDPHGVSVLQGNSLNNSNLINFDISVVYPNSDSELYYQDDGKGRCSCALLCHGKDHKSGMMTE
jgi:predicted CXXCH cytochrome family protein